MYQSTESRETWAHRIVGSFPPRWEKKLLTRWDQRRRAHQFGDLIGEYEAGRDANIELREVAHRLDVVRIPLDASDSTICQSADEQAARCKALATATMAGQKAGPWRFNPVFGRDVLERPLMGTPTMRRFAMARIVEGAGIEPPVYRWILDDDAAGAHVEDGPAMARMMDPQWWRLQLRKVHAKQVEGAAIALGYVNKGRDPYVSNESVMRRAQQNERNAQALEATTCTNEEGQEFKLAELAAKGPANKAIRRAELMTRIAGFERIADDLGHVGMFMTMTCPSRMHKWRTVANGRVLENPKYDGTLPNEAQQHLAKVWARIRAHLARRGIKQYGFRIAEPNHDGTPHWHLLVFLDPAYQGDKKRSAVARFRAIVRRYALADSATERGAKAHRVDFKPIDKGRGSAAGYIAKYVSKNIDGYKLDKDLIGNDAVQTSHRVEAWASTWRIRQFQQVGGPPVGPWRELRRVKAMPSNAPQHLLDAHQAVNKTKALDDLSDSQQQTVKGAQWDAYCKAQGGVFCGRGYSIRVEQAQREGLNKYGEPLAPVPVGVSTLETYTPAHMAWMGGKAVRRVIVESARYVWTIARKVGGAIGRVFNAAISPPWTCVNNCTGGSDDNSENSEGGDRKSRFNGGGIVGHGPSPHTGDGGGLCKPTLGGNRNHQ